MLERVIKITIIVFGTLIAVQNFGINVMSLIAGLGLGGLAFALAAKDTAANLFGSIMILSDNPFKVGDVIVADGTEGTVEAIGFRSTRVRTFYNSLITIPNANLANANIDNMGQRKMRRYRATLGLTYDTSPEKIEEFVNECREIIKNHRLTNNDNFNVAFYGYGDFSLNVLMNFFYDVKDWKDELDGRQEINLEILKMAKRIGVEFAFPTTTVHLEKPSS
jgi:MscS family membrane protein